MSETRCSICQTLVHLGEASERCPECERIYHASCWAELSGCATYGCSKAPTAKKPAPAAYVGGGWGDEKACPSCGKTIASSLLLCGCGARFPFADVITREEWRGIQAKARATAGAKKSLVLLFVLSLFGLPAPVLGPIAGGVAWRKRRLLAGADGTYLAMGYGAAALGVTYLTILLLLGLGL